HVVDGMAAPDALARELYEGLFDAVVSFSSFFGAVTLPHGGSLFEALGVRFLGWQLDHPIYAPHSLARPSDRRHPIYANHNHLRFAQALRVRGPATALVAGGEPPAAPLKAFRKRACPVFVAASFNGAPQALWEQLPDSLGKQLLESVIRDLAASREA